MGPVSNPLVIARKDAARLNAGRFVVHNLVSSALRVRYQRSALGFLWTLLHPLLLLTVLSIVFSRVLQLGMDHYPVFLFAGLVPWQFFHASLTAGSLCLITNQQIIRKTGVQLLLFPLSAVLIAALNMLLAMTAMLLLLTFFGARLSVHAVLVPVGVGYLFVFTFGLVLVSMSLTTFFRDFEHILTVLLQALYFLTPVFYSAQQVPQQAAWLKFNPLASILAFFQFGFYYHTWPPPQTWLTATGAAGGALIVGYAVYKRLEYEYIFRL
jgi:ABC-type polysaccharide/polyol phosphate export permease